MAVLLDGDVLRAAVAEDLGYSVAERRTCARRYGRLAAVLVAQGVHVVVATISMFDDVRAENRARIPRYFEVYVRAPRDVRRARRSEASASQTQMVGDDVPWDEPCAPDLLLDNDGRTALADVAERLWCEVRERCALAD